jgi:hypothetical protein
MHGLRGAKTLSSRLTWPDLAGWRGWQRCGPTPVANPRWPLVVGLGSTAPVLFVDCSFPLVG